MPNYNYLPNNKSDFPLVKNVDTYKYDNDFDYSRYDYTQMSLQICTVPWDMGEAHIGARTISGIGNVVYFETKEKRNAWFDAIPDDECYRFETKFKELHRDQFIDVPIPYDMCAKHNYLRVQYNLFANDGSPVQYEGEDGLREWFWFIREVEFLAPNTTRLHILDDAFQTWIYDVDVSGMILERGHAPMFETDAETYLANPIENNTYLLTEDVSFGDASQVSNIDAVVLNAGEMYAFVATTATPQGQWANAVPAAPYYYTDGNLSVYVFCLPVASIGQFFANVEAQAPQFKQTVQCVFFASLGLFDLGEQFTFCDTVCYLPLSKRVKLDLTELGKDLFGYPEQYADIAKLYTMPYAHIEVADENGQVDVIKIEDTTGTLQVSAALSLAYPFITVNSHLLGAGGAATRNITFRNIDAKTFDIGGQWYDYLHSWNVPTFGIILNAATENDYSTRFDRAQRVVDYTTERVNAFTAAAVNETNTANSADTAEANEYANADTLVGNTDLQQQANSATTARSNQSANSDSANKQNYNSGMALVDNTLIGLTATSTIAANEEQATISAASGIATSGVNAVGAALTGNPVGAVTGMINGAIGAASTIASTQVANGLTATNAAYSKVANTGHANASNTLTQQQTDVQTGAATDFTTIQNNLIAGTNANSAATQKANATRNKQVAYGNASRTKTMTEQNAQRSADQAQSAIDNDIHQAALRAPFMYGDFANGENSATKPMALFSHVVTQSKAAIAAAGDEFLRYGYRLDMQWHFDGNWNVGKYFTYWKLRDFWVTNLNVPDMYMDKLRFFLYGGVTVWRDPADIGRRTVYENYNDQIGG